MSSGRLPKKNILVDGNNLLHRAKYVFVRAREKRGDFLYMNDKGYSTGMIYGVLSMLLDWIPQIAGYGKVYFFLDGSSKRRRNMYPDYKKRDEKEVEQGPLSESKSITLVDGYEAPNEIAVITYLLRLAGVTIYRHPDEEADDLIATFVKQNPGPNVIISSDKDMYQLVTDTTILYRPGIEGNRFFDAERVISDLGVDPGQVRMYKTLKGDVSDNIPGVPRLRATVVRGVCHHQDIDSLYKSGFPKFSKREKTCMVSMVDQVKLNWNLVGLVDDLDLKSCETPPKVDIALAVRILNQDLNISDLDLFVLSGGNRFKEEEGFSVISCPVISADDIT